MSKERQSKYPLRTRAAAVGTFAALGLSQPGVMPDVSQFPQITVTRQENSEKSNAPQKPEKSEPTPGRLLIAPIPVFDRTGLGYQAPTTGPVQFPNRARLETAANHQWIKPSTERRMQPRPLNQGKDQRKVHLQRNHGGSRQKQTA